MSIGVGISVHQNEIFFADEKSEREGGVFRASGEAKDASGTGGRPSGHVSVAPGSEQLFQKTGVRMWELRSRSEPQPAN